MVSQNDMGAPKWLLPGLTGGHHQEFPNSFPLSENSSTLGGCKGLLNGGGRALRRTA